MEWGLLVQFGVVFVGYGKLTQKMDSQAKGSARQEKALLELNTKLDTHIQYHLERE